MKLSNGEVVIIDDLIPLQQQINLYVEACSLPYRLVGSNKYDIQDIKTQKESFGMIPKLLVCILNKRSLQTWK